MWSRRISWRVVRMSWTSGSAASGRAAAEAQVVGAAHVLVGAGDPGEQERDAAARVAQSGRDLRQHVEHRIDRLARRDLAAERAQQLRKPRALRIEAAVEARVEARPEVEQREEQHRNRVRAHRDEQQRDDGQHGDRARVEHGAAHGDAGVEQLLTDGDPPHGQDEDPERPDGETTVERQDAEDLADELHER